MAATVAESCQGDQRPRRRAEVDRRAEVGRRAGARAVLPPDFQSWSSAAREETEKSLRGLSPYIRRRKNLLERGGRCPGGHGRQPRSIPIFQRLQQIGRA